MATLKNVHQKVMQYLNKNPEYLIFFFFLFIRIHYNRQIKKEEKSQNLKPFQIKCPF